MENQKQEQAQEQVKKPSVNEIVGTNKLYLHSKDRKILERYYKTDCVVAYTKNNLGVCFIIKGIKGYYSFIYYCNLRSNYGSFNSYRITEREAIKLIDNNDNESMVIQEHIDKIRNLEVVRALK